MAHLKLRMARLKLQGSNPVHILQDELKHSFVSTIDEIYVNHYIEKGMGVEQHNIRRRLKMKDLTAKEQVCDCYFLYYI